MTIRSALHSDQPSKNSFTAGEIFVTPFRLSVDRQSTISFESNQLHIKPIKPSAWWYLRRIGLRFPRFKKWKVLLLLPGALYEVWIFVSLVDEMQEEMVINYMP